MKHAAWIWPAAAATVFVACSYPDFHFRDETETSGEGGAGQGSQTASTATAGGSTAETSSTTNTTTGSATTSSSTTGGGVVVPCKTPPDDIDCAPDAVCCYSTESADLDTCGTEGRCGADFYEYSCNEAADCDGLVCCGTDSDLDGQFNAIKCQANCDAFDEYIICGLPSECGGLTCQPVPGYGAYKYCGI